MSKVISEKHISVMGLVLKERSKIEEIEVRSKSSVMRYDNQHEYFNPLLSELPFVLGIKNARPYLSTVPMYHMTMVKDIDVRGDVITLKLRKNEAGINIVKLKFNNYVEV